MKIILISFALSTVLLMNGCSTEQPTVTTTSLGATVTTVDGQPIYEPMLQFYARSRAQKEVDQLTPEERESLLDELIQLRLLASAAESEDFLEDEEFAAELEIQRLQMIARRMIGTYLDQNPVTETELQQAYAESSEQLADTQYRARHILVETEAEAAEIIQQLNDGADFQELARTRSTGPSGPNGGDLGWFTADRMVPPFATAVREMEVGTHSTVPVQTRFGWHVLLLEEKSDARAPDLDAVRGDITNLVEQRKVQEYLDQLRENADIIG
jgi:peptidyl-prolyl cis-trans isomerase C